MADPVEVTSPATQKVKNARHRRNKAQVDPAAAREAWKASEKGSSTSKAPTDPVWNAAFDPAQDVTPVRHTPSDAHIQAGSEHQVDTVDWAAASVSKKDGNTTAQKQTSSD